MQTQPKRIAALNLCVLGLCVLALSPAVEAQPKPGPVPDNLRIEPGKRIGRVFIGDTPGAVRRRLGKPSRSFKLGAGSTSELWRSGKYTLEVVYKAGHVIQIEATNPAFETADGLGLHSTVKSWAAQMGEDDTQSLYTYPNKPRMFYYDWKDQGLTLEATPDKKGRLHLLTVIVHREGGSVIPDKGGTSDEEA